MTNGVHTTAIYNISFSLFYAWIHIIYVCLPFLLIYIWFKILKIDIQSRKPLYVKCNVLLLDCFAQLIKSQIFAYRSIYSRYIQVKKVQIEIMNCWLKCFILRLIAYGYTSWNLDILYILFITNIVRWKFVMQVNVIKCVLS